MEHYKLTFKDKLYFFFHLDYIDRFSYLFPKVEQHETRYFRVNIISFPYDFNGYLKSYTNHLIWEYEYFY